MSSQQFPEKKEVEVSVRKTVCDLCEEVISEATVRLMLSATIETHDRSDRPSGYSETSRPVDICSSECLRNNLSGLLLLLQSKIVPAIAETKTDYANIKAIAPPDCYAKEKEGLSLGERIKRAFRL